MMVFIFSTWEHNELCFETFIIIFVRMFIFFVKRFKVAFDSGVKRIHFFHFIILIIALVAYLCQCIFTENFWK